MSKEKFFTVVMIMMCLVACGQRGTSDNAAQEKETADELMRYAYGIPVDSFYVADGEVREGETLGGLLARLGASSRVVNGLVAVPREVFDVRRFRAGVPYEAFYSLEDSVLTYFVYKKDRVESVVFHVADSLHVERQLKEVICEMKRAEARVESSLWNAMVANNLPVQLALDLSDVYQWTIDFFGLQTGDSVRAYYEQLSVEGEPIGIGRIHAANFYHGGKWTEAYFFDNEEPFCRGYFAADGTNQRKAFLKAPLNYKRISSHFTYHRKHPIFGVVRPHTGVDYAAPAGTPVVTIGDGVVIEKGYKGGGGNTVKIRHNSVYTTAYLHLSKYGTGIAVGKHVAQGDVIGYVGSSGNSTGPHLDFRVWKNGQPVDPLHMEAPAADPVPASLMDVYQARVDSLAPYVSNIARSR